MKLSCRRETARCFVSLNISLSNSRSLETTPFDKSSSYLRSVVTIGLCPCAYTIRLIGRHTSCFKMCLLTYLLIYVLILYRFLDKANCWSKIAIFSYPIPASVRYPCRDIAVRFDMEKFMVMEKVGYVYRFDTIPAFARQTDRRTSCDSIVCAMRTHRAIKTACMCTKQPHYFSTLFIPTASDYGRIDCEREGRGRAGRPSREGWMRSLSNQYVTDC